MTHPTPADLLNERVAPGECDYRRLFESSPVPTWVYDRETRRILAVNDAALRQYGYPREEFLALTLDHLRPPEDVPALAAGMAAEVNVAGDMGLWRHRRKDGSVFPVRVYSSDVHWQGRTARAAVLHPTGGASASVSAGAPPRPSVDALAIFDSITDAFLILDRDGRFTFLNRQAEALLRRPRAELLGRVTWDEFPEAAGRRFFPEFRRAMREEVPISFEEDYPPCGVRVEVRAFPSHLGLCVYLRDVTERHREGEALRGSEARFRTLADTAPVPVWMTDAAGECVFVSRAWLDSTGRTPQQAAGKGWLDCVHPEDRSRLAPLYAAAMATHSRFEFEYRLLQHDGSYRWVLDAGRPRSGPDGAFAGYVGSCADIHSVREAEEARERLHREQAEAAARQRAFLRDVLFSVTEGRLLLCDGPAGLPEALPAVGEPIPVSLPELATVRRRVSAAAAERAFPDIRRYDVMSAASECAMNAVQHGGGVALARVCAGPDRLQVWIEDHGKGIELTDLPKATLLRGHSGAGGFGHGFFLMLQACDRIHLLTGPEGTTVVLEQAREEPPEPTWPSF